MSAKEIDATINMLAASQGFYGRLRERLREVDSDTRQRFYDQFAGCTDSVDFVMQLEG